MIRIDLVVIVIGVAAVWLPIGINMMALVGLVIIGFGCAPVYPSIIHATFIWINCK